MLIQQIAAPCPPSTHPATTSSTPPTPYPHPHPAPQLWKRLFPSAAVSFIELDAKCAESFRADIEATGGRLYTGPQADPATLAPVLADAASLGPFDLIVDDGGHHPEHQRRSLELLWPALRPFGVYVVGTHDAGCRAGTAPTRIRAGVLPARLALSKCPASGWM